jgi:hypothetical protein
MSPLDEKAFVQQVDLSECRWVGGVISDSLGRPIAEWWLGNDGSLADRIADARFTVEFCGPERE